MQLECTADLLPLALPLHKCQHLTNLPRPVVHLRVGACALAQPQQRGYLLPQQLHFWSLVIAGMRARKHRKQCLGVLDAPVDTEVAEGSSQEGTTGTQSITKRLRRFPFGSQTLAIKLLTRHLHSRLNPPARRCCKSELHAEMLYMCMRAYHGYAQKVSREWHTRPRFKRKSNLYGTDLSAAVHACLQLHDCTS